MTAQLLKRGPICIGLLGWSQRDCYRVDPPIEGHAIVAVSRSHTFGVNMCGLTIPSRSETCIFPASPDTCDIADYCVLDGSRKGSIRPADLLRELGYTVNEVVG